MILHNFFFLSCFSQKLHLSGEILQRAYVVNENELIIEFGNNSILKVFFEKGPIVFSFFSNPYSPPAQIKPRFRKLWGQKIANIKLVPYERVLLFKFTNHEVLAFVLYGNRSNLLHFTTNQDPPLEMLRYKQKADEAFTLNLLKKSPLNESDFPINISQKPFFEKQLVSKMPKSVYQNENELHSDLVSLERKASWKFNSDTRSLELIINENSNETLTSLQAFYVHYTSNYTFLSLKKALLTPQQNTLKKAEKDKLQTLLRIEVLANERPLNELADIIMSNLHQIKARVQNVVLEDYYKGGTIEIQLPENLSPVQYATKLYKKSPGREKELLLLKEKINSLDEKIKNAKAIINHLETIENLKELKSLTKKKEVEKNQKPLPYKEYQLMGYTIRIGNNAVGNDEMLRAYAHKDDLWLHAFELAGSHVLIKKHIKGEVPKRVIEAAASWAAYFSKGKNRETVPVMITERKYVRKGKGLRPGQVLVDSFKTIIAKPENPII
jgi:predicted ribosome quality control (RQC) complex YloA/Tae2 family protein